MSIQISGGTVHTIPHDLGNALGVDKTALAKWKSLTPIAYDQN